MSTFRGHKGVAHYLTIEDRPWCSFPYNVDGFIEEEFNFMINVRDIVSEWQEPINEEEVDRLAEEFCDKEYENPTDVNKAQNGMELGYSNLFNCYKAGYRKGFDTACDIFADIINEVLPINASDMPYIKNFRNVMEDYLNGKSNI